MKKIVAGMSVAGMALALAACGGNNPANDTVVNAAVENETLFNDELPADGNLSALGNGDEIAPPLNAADANDTAVANAL